LFWHSNVCLASGNGGGGSAILVRVGSVRLSHSAKITRARCRTMVRPTSAKMARIDLVHVQPAREIVHAMRAQNRCTQLMPAQPMPGYRYARQRALFTRWRLACERRCRGAHQVPQCTQLHAWRQAPRLTCVHHMAKESQPASMQLKTPDAPMHVAQDLRNRHGAKMRWVGLSPPGSPRHLGQALTVPLGNAPACPGWRRPPIWVRHGVHDDIYHVGVLARCTARCAMPLAVCDERLATSRLATFLIRD